MTEKQQVTNSKIFVKDTRAKKREKLKLSNVIGFGLGDFGFGLFWTSTNLYLLYFYTDVLGLSSTTAGAIFMIAMIWDGISDPLVGYITGARSRGKKGYRRYILWGALPLAISFAMLFYTPKFSDTNLIIYTLISHLVFRTCYTIVSVPYGALMSQMTSVADERSALAVARMLCAAAAGIVVAITMVELATYLGQGDSSAGFFFAACILATISLPFFIATYSFTTERKIENENHISLTPNVRDSLSMLRMNKPFIIFFISVVLGMMASTIADKISIYYIIYALDSKEVMGTALAVFGLTTAISLPFWGWLSKRTSKRHVWLSGLAILSFTSVGIFISPHESLESILPFWIVASIGKGALFFAFWATFPDTVEFGEWKSGIRSPAFLTGISTFAQKVSLGLGIGLLGLFLDVIQYKPNLAQSLDTLESMKWLMTLLPAVAYCIVFAIVFRYPIDQKLHSRLVNAIEARHARAKRSK